MKSNFTAYVNRYTEAIRKLIDTEMRLHILKRACENLNYFDEYLQAECLRGWAREFKLSEKILFSYKDGSEAELSKTELLREKLWEFDIYENIVSGELSIMQNGKRFTIDELEYFIKNDGYKFSRKELMTLLSSQNENISVVKKYNPLEKFFLELAENYDRENHIQKLCGYIPAYDFGTGKDYQKRLYYYVRKWLAKAVGQVLGIAKNDAMLLWIEPIGGSGKSEINKWLFSIPEIQKYSLIIRQNESFLDMKGISQNKFSVDFDELPLSKNKYLQFKSYIGSDGGQKYHKSSKSYQNYERNVNFIGSTNKANRERQPGFLLDDDDAVKRRIISIELGGRINYTEYLEMDLYQIWGQAAFEILKAEKEKNRKFLTWECDWAEMREQNDRYLNITKKGTAIDKTIFLKYFKPAEKDNGRLLRASDMKNELSEQGIKIDLSNEQIGRILAQNFVPGRQNYRGYWVK